MPIELQHDCFARGFREFGIRASSCGDDSQSCGSVIASCEKIVAGDCQIRSSYAKLHFVYFRGSLKEMFNKKPLIPSARCAIGQDFPVSDVRSFTRRNPGMIAFSRSPLHIRGGSVLQILRYLEYLAETCMMFQPTKGAVPPLPRSERHL
jgi:hypothetical protein